MILGMKSFLLGREDKANSQSYIWYSIGGLLNACQSAILLFIISRTNTDDDSGVYSIGYAIACIAFTVGSFGMRNFQATDVKHKYSFRTYLYSRIITDIGMILVILYHLLRGYIFIGYTPNKCAVILMLGLLKLVDSFEDVWHGLYHNLGRLDVAGRCMTTRFALMIISMAMGLVCTHDLLTSSCIACGFSLIYFIWTTLIVYPEVKEQYLNSDGTFKDIEIGALEEDTVSAADKKDLRAVPGLLKENLALFAGAFLALYIANAPKYAIDEFMTGADQAMFNYIFMPVYMVNVLNTFIYQPMLATMASSFEIKDFKMFIKLFFRQIGIIILLVLAVLLGGYLLGIPILSLFYNTDLSDHKLPFMILLIGSGFLGMEGYLQAIITVMRKQNLLLIGFGISAVLALALSRQAVIRWGIMGAAMLYSGIIMLQMLVFIVLFTILWRKKPAK